MNKVVANKLNHKFMFVVTSELQEGAHNYRVRYFLI